MVDYGSVEEKDTFGSRRLLINFKQCERNSSSMCQHILGPNLFLATKFTWVKFFVWKRTIKFALTKMYSMYVCASTHI